MTTLDLTPIRGHLARVGSPAEAYLVAWAEVADRAGDPEVLRAELYSAQTTQHRRERHPDPYWREWYSRRGWGWPAYRATLRSLLHAIFEVEERRDLAGWLLLLAQDAEGYVGEEG
jgi:hypothetical protein